MNKIIIAIIFSFANLGYSIAQSQQYSYAYSYDASGNRTLRVTNQGPYCKSGKTNNDNGADDDVDKNKENVMQERGENRLPVSTVENENGTISITPNPSGGQFMLQGLKFGIQGSVTVYNALGEIIYRELISPETSVKPIKGIFDMDLSMQQKGIYLIKVISGEEIFIKRIAIE